MFQSALAVKMLLLNGVSTGVMYGETMICGKPAEAGTMTCRVESVGAGNGNFGFPPVSGTHASSMVLSAILSCSYAVKKKSLFFLIGPPIVNPGLLSWNGGRCIPLRLLFHVLAFRLSSRKK